MGSRRHAMETLEEYNARYLDGADFSAVNGLKVIRGGWVDHLPCYMDDEEWNGEEVHFYADGSQLLCDCGGIPVRRVCFDDLNIGRRFIACGMPEMEECSFFRWYDPAWPEPMQRCLGQLWKRFEVCRGSAQLNRFIREGVDDKETMAEEHKREMKTLANRAEQFEAMAQEVQGNCDEAIEKMKYDCDVKLEEMKSKALAKIEALKSEVDEKNSWLMLSVGAFVGVFASIFLKICCGCN